MLELLGLIVNFAHLTTGHASLEKVAVEISFKNISWDRLRNHLRKVHSIVHPYNVLTYDDKRFRGHFNINCVFLQWNTIFARKSYVATNCTLMWVMIYM